MREVIQNHQKSLYIIYSAIIIAILSLVLVNLAYADENLNLNYSVTVEPALNITTSSNKVSLDLNPLNHDFDSQDLTVSVSTNNETGYKLYVNAEKTTTNPNGNKLIEKDDSSLYIDTLSSETPGNDFTANRWGYGIGSGNYLPFESGILLNSSKTQIENNSSTLTFAAKVGYETKAGTYNLALNFQATANPKCDTTVEGTMQEFDPCPDLEDGTKGTLTDVRDGATYTVAKINGNWWMTQNLRYMGDTVGSTSTTSTWYLKSATSNVSADTTMSMTDLTSGNSYDAARFHNSGNTAYGVWYNYAAVSAMTITGSDNTAPQTYDICPKNWRLPTGGDNSEQARIVDRASDFSPVAGGLYYSGGHYDPEYGIWWSATSNGGNYRYLLRYDGNTINVNYGNQGYGRYARCIRST